MSTTTRTTCPRCGEETDIAGELYRSDRVYTLDTVQTQNPGAFAPPTRKHRHGDHTFWAVYVEDATRSNLFR